MAEAGNRALRARLPWAALLLAGLIGLSLGARGSEGESSPAPESTAAEAASDRSAPSEAAPGLVLAVTIDGAIGPATTALMEEAIDAAGEKNAAALVLELNTPGGLVVSTREINAAILASDTPVIGYVAPSGAHAASAGTFILYATSLAAMAPGTNIGAATPVQMGGMPGSPTEPQTPPDGEGAGEGDKPEGEAKDDAPKSGTALERKSTNDAAAYIVSLAELHGRNAEWAEKAVRDAETLTANEALEENVIEVVATSLEDLLAKADGRSVIVDGEERTLATKGARVERHKAGFLIEVLAVLANPNVAYFLLMIGLYGLIFEFANPGTIGPGVIGAICLILGLYALNQLPLDYTGVALIVLGLLLMAGEAISPSFGVLGLGGIISFIIGSALLFDTDRPEFQLSWTTIFVAAALSGGILILLLAYVWQSFRQKVVTGREEMEGILARVLDWEGTEGHVWAHSERWTARGPKGLAEGDPVRVTELDGLVLVVSAASEGGR